MFRFDTFGDEKLWIETLRLHKVVEKRVDRSNRANLGVDFTDLLAATPLSYNRRSFPTEAES